jgi:hypothetical protein
MISYLLSLVPSAARRAESPVQKKTRQATVWFANDRHCSERPPVWRVHLKIVCERCCHATVSITRDTYSHAIPALQEEAATLIAGLVFSGK